MGSIELRMLIGKPKNSDEANQIQERMNFNSDVTGIKWKFSFGYILECSKEGGFIHGEFLPPSKSGHIWSGSVCVFVGKNNIHRKNFHYIGLEKLQSEVELYITSLEVEIIKAISGALKQ